MRAAIDRAGRVVIPKKLRDELGLTSGPVEVVRDGAAVRIEPISTDTLERVSGRLVVPASGDPIDDTDVRDLRLSGSVVERCMTRSWQRRHATTSYRW